MNGDQRLYAILKELGISFEYYEHQELPTALEAEKVWKDIDSTHCKNLFFRNHKGNRHYLVILEYSQKLDIRDLEQRLKQGKITLGSDRRLLENLGLTPGSVSPFGLINDKRKHVHIFFDKQLLQAKKLTFHPNINTASLVLDAGEFWRFIDWTGNSYEFIQLYD
ncbi:MAG: prolyl-tRNA synthetase associated domain-containing protein [Bacteroidetes bacterium]|nr:prolyl-tRNA synthetase associated domain-containing protein [Bacteroidota bacterium]MBU1720396.1 prolyl-tRNA synthetase associated domain-containing protein [Bacteroidota bacterium]